MILLSFASFHIKNHNRSLCKTRICCFTYSLLNLKNQTFHNIFSRNDATIGKINKNNKKLILYHIRCLNTLKNCDDTKASVQCIVDNSNNLNTFKKGLLFKYLPSKLVPYALLARLDKPAGTWLLFLPCSWSIGMASFAAGVPLLDTLYLVFLFGTGAFIMRGAGCTINDLWDRNLDKKVERTKMRPLASGVLSPRQAIVFLSLQLSTGLAVLLQLNLQSIVLGASSLALVIAYPLMKRFTFWPQAFLGLTFNWGALLGWVAILDSMNFHVMFPLYFSSLFWTLLYDTIYALQDRAYDKKAGIKSSALAVKGKTKKFLSVFAIGQAGLLALSGFMNSHGPLFYLISVGGSIIHSGWQIKTLKENQPTDAARKFKSNIWLGSLITLGIFMDLLHKKLFKNENETIQNKED